MADLFGKENITVRIYDEVHGRDHGLVLTALEALGVEAGALSFSAERINTGLSGAALTLMRELNRFQAAHTILRPRGADCATGGSVERRRSACAAAARNAGGNRGVLPQRKPVVRAGVFRAGRAVWGSERGRRGAHRTRRRRRMPI
ncbi:MAG: hypothetical protein WDN04_19490 [Rhodospirillales bacterium]